MLRLTRNRLVLSLLLAALGIVVSNSFTNARAMKVEKPLDSKNYFSVEIESGIAGAVTGSFVGAITGAVVGSYLRGSSCGSGLWEFSGLICVSDYLIAGYLVGNALGGIYGVVRFGGPPHHVPGSVTLATLGAVIGEALAMVILRYVPGLHAVLLIPGLTSLGAVIGYNSFQDSSGRTFLP